MLISSNVNLEVTFVGTGDYIPSQQRNTKTVHLQRGSETFLLDLGEGAVREMMKLNLDFVADIVFLSAVSYDHISGLPGLVNIYDSNHIARDDPLQIFTPAGTANQVKDLVYEYGDVRFPITVEEVSPGTVIEKDGYVVQALETDSDEVSVGYSLSEKSRRGRFNRQKAEELGVKPGPKFGKLTEGESVKTEQGTVVQPEEVLGDPRPGRKVVYTGDTRPVDSIVRESADADLLIHDSAFAEHWDEKAVEKGHSTALEAGKVAEKANVKQLVLFSISPRFTGWGYRLKQEAESVYDGEVLVADDGLGINIPLSDEGTQEIRTGHDGRSADQFYTVGRRTENLRSQIQNLREVVNSGYLDNFDKQKELSESLDDIISAIENSVLVLGNYDGRHSDELDEVKSFLEEQGYDANTADDLPHQPDKSLEQNIAFYMMMSKFCVMVDRESSGHLNEYEIARNQRNILARLTPQNSGSTYMIGGEEEIDINYISSFEFKYSPTDVIEGAVKWAEDLAQERENAYKNQYPWRDSEST